MKRKRELVRPSISKDGNIRELGSLIVIVYKGSKKERMRIDGFLRRAPYIRLCKGVYAFSHWHKRFDKKQELVDARIFWNFIREVDENAVAIPRLIIDNHESIEQILNETKTRIEKEIDHIIMGHQNLYEKMVRNEGGRQYVLSTTRKLKRRFVTIKKMTKFYEQWLRINQSHLLLKPYSIIRKLDTLLGAKYEVTLLKNNNVRVKALTSCLSMT